MDEAVGEKSWIGMQALAALVPLLSEQGARFQHWEVDAGGPQGARYRPYLVEGAIASAFRDAVQRGELIRPISWGSWADSDEGRALREDREALARATPEQLANLVTALVRADRFAAGTLDAAFASGLLLGVARRAAALVAEREG